jgi:hypothetical protein
LFSLTALFNTQDGVTIEGESEFTKEFPSLRARATIAATPKEVFDLIMDDSKRTQWDDNVRCSDVLREVGENFQIVYTQLKEIWIGPMWTGPRDLVLLRYWRQDEEVGCILLVKIIYSLLVAPAVAT